MMGWSRLLLVPAVGVVLLAAWPAAATSEAKGHFQCILGHGFAYEATIADCTSYIDSGVARSLAELGRAHYIRGRAYSAIRQFERAEADLNTAITLEPDFPDGYRQRGLVELNQYRYDPAIADFTATLRLAPDNANAYYNRAMGHLGKNDFTAADADLTAAERLSPNSMPILDLHGDVLWRLGRRDEAVAAFDRVVREKPPGLYKMSLSSRARVRAEQGKDDLAWNDVETCIRDVPRFADCYDQRGLLLEKRGDDARALADFDTATTLNPSFPDYFKDRAALREKLGDHAGAAADRAHVAALDARERPGNLQP